VLINLPPHDPPSSSRRDYSLTESISEEVQILRLVHQPTGQTLWRHNQPQCLHERLDDVLDEMIAELGAETYQCPVSSTAMLGENR